MSVINILFRILFNTVKITVWFLSLTGHYLIYSISPRESFKESVFPILAILALKV